MYKILKLQPISNHLYLKINILRGMMYCGILWGLYNTEQQGWAMTSDHDDYVFPFWLNGLHAHQYAQLHWPNYIPKKITPQDFQSALLPTLSRLKVTPALCNGTKRMKLSTSQMRHFFFNDPILEPA